jgi:hypothetical protein
MARKKITDIEVLPPVEQVAPVEPLLLHLVREQIDRAVDKAVAERMGEDVEAARQKSLFQRHKHRLYYEKWGCRLCSTKDRVHASGGLCNKCLQLWAGRDRQLEREFNRQHPPRHMTAVEQVSHKFRTAERLLGTTTVR